MLFSDKQSKYLEWKDTDTAGTLVATQYKRPPIILQKWGGSEKDDSMGLNPSDYQSRQIVDEEELAPCLNGGGRFRTRTVSNLHIASATDK